MNITIKYYTDNGNFNINNYKRNLVRCENRATQNIVNTVNHVQYKCQRLGMFACIIQPNGAEIWCNV